MRDHQPSERSNVASSAIHRESNPSDEERQIVVVRSGSGERVINVEGPESPGNVLAPEAL